MADKLNSDNKSTNITENSKENIKNQIDIEIQSQKEGDNNGSTTTLNQKDEYSNSKKEHLYSTVINEFKKLKEETGCTSEELLEILMNIEKEDNTHEEEEEEAQDIGFEETEEQDYGSAEYWENRYTICPDTFDWYQKWEAINSELYQLFTGDELVLNIGCGNSEMSASMQKTTFKVVVSIDISGVVIEQMIEKYKDNKDLIWFEMDCMNLTFEDEFFDIVFDKGTFDAILCGMNSIENVYSSMSEIWRVLKLGGLFIEITYGEPSNRLDLFKHSGLSWKLYEPIVLDNSEDDSDNDADKKSGNNHYIYIFQKLLNYEEEENLNDDTVQDSPDKDNINSNENYNQENEINSNKGDSSLDNNNINDQDN